MKTLAEHIAVSAGRYSSPDSRSPLSPPMHQVMSLWMQRWQNRLLSTWLHVSLYFTADSPSLYSRPAGILSASLYCSLLDPLVLVKPYIL